MGSVRSKDSNHNSNAVEIAVRVLNEKREFFEEVGRLGSPKRK